MDFFGIGSGLRAGFEIYCQTARRTGKTTRLLDSLKDGDRVVCADKKEKHRLHSMCRERNLRVTILEISPAFPEKLRDYEPPEGNTVFEHSWVEQYYKLALSRAEAEIDLFQQKKPSDSEGGPDPRRVGRGYYP